jgi:hypothetical protein
VTSRQGQVRQEILSLVESFAQEMLAPQRFIPGESPVPVSGKVLDPSDIAALVDASLDGWLTAGRFHEDFERALARYVGARSALFVNSGSSANLVALSALTSPKLGKRALRAGDEVLTVAAGFPTTVNPIIQNNLKPVLVDVNQIYEEFGGGASSPVAIRDFVRMVYLKSNQNLKYLLLFGDASYDYKSRIFNNNNIVPIFHGFNPNASETNNVSNMSLFSSFMSDDFYGLMDDDEGPMLSGIDGIDIAVGRMLVSTVQQAQEMVNKVIEYHAEPSYGRWRNNYVIYSDDADNLTDATLQFRLDDLADNLVNQKPFVNIKKIHTDAYVQQVAAGGDRYPQAKNEFLDALELGALVFNYFGHGNEEFLARERLFEKLDAQNLKNRYRYPLFITITCEFTRFDDPNRQTGGEFMYWNNQGGAIALIATTRQIGVSTGLVMNNYLSQELYAFGSNTYPTISEAVRRSKLLPGTSDNRRVISFIGDPAMKLAIPKQKVILT